MPTFNEYYEARQRAYEQDGSSVGDQAFELAKNLHGRMKPWQKSHLAIFGHSLEDTWPFRTPVTLVEELFKASSDGA